MTDEPRTVKQIFEDFENAVTVDPTIDIRGNKKELKTMCGPPPEGWRIGGREVKVEGCDVTPCDSCVSYGKSQQGQAIHFVSEEAKKEFYDSLSVDDYETSVPLLKWREEDPTDPEYYHLPIEPREYIVANNLGWCEGNIVKYVSRWRQKGGIDDLKKARNYIDFLVNNWENPQ